MPKLRDFAKLGWDGGGGCSLIQVDLCAEEEEESFWEVQFHPGPPPTPSPECSFICVLSKVSTIGQLQQENRQILESVLLVEKTSLQS